MVAAVVGRSGANRLDFPKWLVLLLVVVINVASPASGSFSVSESQLRNIIGKADCPEYFVLGHQKCGSKLLHKQITEYLEFAPALQDRFSSQSSYNFFTRFKAPLFQSNTKVPLVDISPDYFRTLDAPLRIKSFCNYSGAKKSPPKFVVSLCDPVNRTWAAFRDSHGSSDKMSGTDKFQAKAGYTFHKLTDAGATSDKFIQESYERCIRTTLPMVHKCLESMTYPQCYRALFGTTGPNTDHLIPDALGIPFPCKGVVFNSLYKQQLDYWTSVFPKEDFLVLYMDDWLEDQQAALEAVSRHFPGASLASHFENDFSPIKVQRSLAKAPKESQDWLRMFFNEHRGWVDQVEVLGGHESSYASISSQGNVSPPSMDHQ